MIWKIRGKEVPLDKTLLVGVLNLTPDSFSDGGDLLDPARAVARAGELIEAGADILDVGAESTRPGADPVSSDDELLRLLPVLQALCKHYSVPLSVDTTKPEVAYVCLQEGAHIINDVSGSGSQFDVSMAHMARDFGAGLIMMHRRGTAETMQSLTAYDDVIAEVVTELRDGVDQALSTGLDKSSVVIDPGLGFAKTAEQNLQILRNIERFNILDLPVMIGPSRKSFLGTVTGREVHGREYATAAVVAYAVMKRIPLVRVHQVGAMRDVVKIIQAIEGEKYVRTF
ncbi:MAG: dihydropteroate synthase [Candidatus Omnitrophota bacterium]|nr:dihydropteroate synthase [Candidatus Omnitrophota bacterium]